MARPITSAQLRCLQVLWSQRMRQAGIRPSSEDARELRHQFVREATSGRATATKELSATDARLVMRLLSGQQSLTIEDAGAAQAAGTHGRRGYASSEAVLAGAQQFELLDRLRAQLGWDSQRLGAFVGRQLGGRSIRTMADANKVAWGLKSIVRRSAP